ncbi:hypothetical protein PCANC_06421 [Puccinia coronata f. sp. avenae]|uniref:Uncharacterized protein n=1 Tax=Puccinia coronata f. sp. avenae TaxID=200324 RepID=A0A2N5VVT5_9BASI|nr:hypothetical protein PCASD_10047 [Puccinia coronata f. sp. avenae]PLW54113.1 hypothetical protein PCANC_06421 [Puccinia coronata f. sp. avenae]
MFSSLLRHNNLQKINHITTKLIHTLLKPTLLPPPPPPPPAAPEKEITKLRYANNPTELIIRVEKLAQQSRLDLIIQLIKTSSTKVATVSVWTELFKLLIKFNQQHLSYKLYLEIKRRRIQLDLQFYHLYFHLISTAKPSTKHFNLTRLESIWSQSQQLITTTTTTTTPPTNHSKIQLTNAYLNSLIHHGFTSKVFQLFHSLPATQIDSVTLYHLSKSLSSQQEEDLEKAKQLIQKWGAQEDKMDLRTTLSFANLFLKSTNTTHHSYAATLIQERIGIQIHANPYKFWSKHQPIMTPKNSSTSPIPNQEENTPQVKNQLRFDQPGQLTTLLRMLLKMKKFSLVRNLWAQIHANPDLYLDREAIDSTHCGLVIIAMGRCGAMDQVEDLLCWMMQSGNKKLRPNSDTLDKAIQAAWQTEDLSSGIAVLASLTHTYDQGLLTAEEEKKAVVETWRQKSKTRGATAISPSNRALVTLLQAAGRIGKVKEISRALETVAQFRTLPIAAAASPPPPPPSTTSPCTPNGKTTQPTLGLGAPESSQEIERYWVDQFVWVATDLLDKLLSRSEHNKVLSQDQIDTFSDWRARIDAFLQQDPSHTPLRSRIESRAHDRLTRLQSRSTAHGHGGKKRSP